MSESGVNNTLLKQQNRGLVLKLIATGECSSRIELSQKTGLAKMTVTYIVNEFLENGTLEEREKEIIFLRYGLATGKEVTQREIGEKLGISRSYV